MSDDLPQREPYERFPEENAAAAQPADRGQLPGVLCSRRFRLLACVSALLGAAVVVFRQLSPEPSAVPAVRTSSLPATSPASTSLRHKAKTPATATSVPAAPAAQVAKASWLPPKLYANKSSCTLVTGGTCRLYGCNGDRGPTYCSHGHCLCRPNYCAKSGQCVHSANTCVKDTGGTCTLLGCASSRGPTKCVDRKCFCKQGYCQSNGVCRREGTCTDTTSGTCKFFNCEEFRGPTKCVKGQCKCQSGFCAENGLCIIAQTTLAAYVQGINQSHEVYKDWKQQAVTVNTALAVSGGGSRSLAFTVGVLRALEHLGLMEKFDAISAVSGGSWATALYMFAHKRHSDKELLGNSQPAKKLKMEVLKKKPGVIGNVVTSSMFPYLARITMTSNEANKLWLDFVSQNILEPARLHDGDNAKFMAASKKHGQDIVARNPDLGAFDFEVPRHDRAKVFVMNGAIMAPSGFQNSQDTVVSLQMSPDFSGSPFYPDGKTQNIEYTMQYDQMDLHNLHSKTIGGGMVESFAFGSAAPSVQYGKPEPTSMGAPGLPFTLANAVGISSCALAGEFARSAGASYLSPDAAIWPVTSEGQKEMTYLLGDGGIIENGGVLAMLQRNVSKIVWLINTDTGLYDDFDWCGADPKKSGFNPNDKPAKITNQLSDKFGYGLSLPTGYLANNKVFAKSKMAEVACDLQKLKKKKKPLVLRKSLPVLANSWWGIRGGYDLDITFVYLERARSFEDTIKDKELKAEIKKGADDHYGHFSHYPFFKTTFQNKPELIKYTYEQVNILSALGEFYITKNEDLFKDILKR